MARSNNWKRGEPRVVEESSLQKAVREFVQTVDGLYGYYLDCTLGFSVFAERLSQTIKVAGSHVFIGSGNPNKPTSRVKHQTTIGELLGRNVKGGQNYARAGQLLVVLVFVFWESGFRGRIAGNLGLESEDLIVPAMGDIRLLRNDVIHNRSVIRSRTTKRLEVFRVPGLKAGRDLSLSEADAERLVRAIKAAMDELVVSAGEPDPQHRTILRLHEGPPRQA